MAKKYFIYVACGSAAATSNLVRSRLLDILQKENINATVEVARISELANLVANRKPDLVIITAGSVTSQGLPSGVPVLSGLPLMTLFGVNDFTNKIKEALFKGGS